MDTVKKFSAFLLLSFFVLPGIAGAAGQDSINELIKNGGIVNLSGTYTLTGPIVLSSDLKLNGQNSTVITIPANADWPSWVPLMKGDGLHDITIEGIEFNANSNGNDETPHGRGYYNCIHLVNSRNVTIRNCIFHDGLGDGLRIKECQNVKFHDNVAYELGHDCFYSIDSEGVLVWNNTLTTRTNSALRLWNSKNVMLFCNRINSQLDSLGGNAGIQIEDSKGTMDNIRVFANTIYETWGPGIWLISYDAGSNNLQNIEIDHNRIIKDGVSDNIDYTAGITINGMQGTNISNNVFDGCNNAGILVLDGGQNTRIEKNIIANIREHPAISQSGTGYGIANRQNAKIYVSNNCFFNNANGNAFRAESVEDDFQDPTRHNTSSEWRWDGSKWLCDYVTTVEGYTIDNSTFENEILGNLSYYSTGGNDAGLYEVTYGLVNNACTSTITEKDVTGCNKCNSNCPSIYNVPLIASITGCTCKTGCASGTYANNQCSVCGSCASSCGNSQVKSNIIDNSHSTNQNQNYCGTGSGSSGSGTSGGESSGQEETATSTTPLLPVPGFTTSLTSGSVPLVVNFHSTAQNAISTKWDFGDSDDNVAVGTDVSHTYSAVGSYIVTQTVSNQNGARTTSAQINVNANNGLTPAAVDFTATPVSGSAPLKVSFTDRSQYTTVPGSTVSYDFGGNEGTINERNPSHTYNVPGVYYATQTVTNPAGGSTKQVAIIVNEAPVIGLAANFNANIRSGVAPLSVTFTDESTGAAAYAWDFGDGLGTTTTQNPSYVFTRAGSYDIVLTVSDGKGHSASKHMLITVTEIPPVTPSQLVADFSADSISGVDPLNVKFTDESTGAVTWQWDFGDNSPVVTTKDAEHTFGVGSWNVNLKVSDGTNFASKTMRITVTEKPVALIADFTADKTAGQVPLEVQFTDESKGSTASWSWDFGDGSQEIGNSPRHIFTNPGKYDVVLTVSDGKGHSDSKHLPITVAEKLEAPTADFTADRTAGEPPLAVQFSDKSASAVSYEWAFGDGETSTEQNPGHTYTAAGNYIVTLTVTGTNGEKSTSQTIITVNKLKTPDTPTDDLNAHLADNATPLNSF